jgi:hypothetical protein
MGPSEREPLTPAEAERPIVVRHAAGDDPRFTGGLIVDVWAVLEQHGYRLPDDGLARIHVQGIAIMQLLRLTQAFEGGESGE